MTFLIACNISLPIRDKQHYFRCFLIGTSDSSFSTEE